MRGEGGVAGSQPRMNEEMDNTSREGAYLRCPVSTSVHFSLRNEGSSEYIRLCEGRERLRSNFQTFSGPQASIPRNWYFGFGFALSWVIHRYICKRNRFLGNFCIPEKFKNLGSGELRLSVTSHFH